MTHRQRLTLASWARLFIEPGWRVEASYRVPGVKDNYAQHARGNGFVTATPASANAVFSGESLG